MTGYQCGGQYDTRNAALDFIARIDDFISEKHLAPEHAAARETIANAYREKAPEAEQPPALKYIIEVYEANGTPRATFRRAAATAPELDIPAGWIDDYKREITKNNRPGKVIFEETAPARLAYLLSGSQEETKADNTTPAPTTPAEVAADEEPTTTDREPETATAPRLKYVFRTFTDWTIYAGMLSEEIITAGSDEEARQKAIDLAAGKAFTCNRMEEGQTARALYGADSDTDPQTAAETDGTNADKETPTDSTEAPQRATETATETTAGADTTTADREPQRATERATTTADKESTTDGRREPQRATQTATAGAETAGADSHRPTQDAPRLDTHSPRGDPQPDGTNAEPNTRTILRLTFLKPHNVFRSPPRKNDFEKPIPVFDPVFEQEVAGVVTG